VTRLTTAELVEVGDLDALVVRIDHLCSDRDWPGVLDLRDRCRRAFEERGRQLVAEADVWMREQRIKNPEAMTRMLAPGF